MHNFVVKKWEIVRGREEVFLLLVDGKSEFEAFCEEIGRDGNLRGELRTILTRLEMVLNGALLPKTHYRPIQIGKIGVKGFELKSHHLRVYLIQEVGSGKLIVMGGKKTSQERDIGRFKKLAKAFAER
jgi:putative component of toxin-antitoxin plasmid stabilization module